MNKGHENSKGQALVMVTLALFAMAGMMGLAVDLGWSFFIQKQAQAAADGAALAAVQEAMAQISTSGGSVTSPTCPATGHCFAQGGGALSGVTALATATSCSQITYAADSNLEVGCLYAQANGFSPATSGQDVTIQAGSGTGASQSLTLNGVVYNGIVYWATVRTVQTIPQLFSAVFSHTQGTVSAIATAAIAASVGPGSFFGMDQAGDPGDSGNVGIDLQGRNSGSSSKSTCGGDICAPMGYILSSQCAGSSTATGGGACSSSSKDAADGGKDLAAGSPVIVAGAGVAINFSSPSTSIPASASTFNDFFAPNPQPPLQTPSSAITSCGYLAGSPTGSGTVPPVSGAMGPYQYYSYYKTSAGLIQPTGAPVQFPSNATFSSSATGCPGAGVGSNIIVTPGAAQTSTTFATFIFWGGMTAQDGTFFGSGQYVMAGTTDASANGVVFNVAQNGTISGDQNIGTMFIFTDGMYPGLWTSTPTSAPGTGQVATIPNGSTYLAGLYQGSLGPFKNATVDLYGMVNSAVNSSIPVPMDPYTGIVWWQDRRNSTVGYDQPASPTCAISQCTGDNGSVIYCNNNSCPAGAPPSSFINGTNHVTATSPGFNFDPGNGRVGLHGAYYQPRGAWMNITAGNAGFDCGGSVANCPLQIVTGMLDLNHGAVDVNLAGPTNPILTYKARLIQ